MAKKNFVGAKGARLLRRVAKHILAEPRRYEQNEIVLLARPGLIYHGRKVPKCGTIACIGGWVEILTASRTYNHNGLNNEAIAKRLGIPESAENHLIAYTNDKETGSSHWPVKYRDRYNKAKTPRAKAKVAAERIEHFIKTGE